MAFPRRILPLALLASGTLSATVLAQATKLARAETPAGRKQVKTFFGLQGGALFFSTQRQTQSGIPAAGAHVSVVSGRGGVTLGFEEGFGSAEPTAFVDSNNSTREMVFDRIRRYGVNLTGYPVQGDGLAPYLGVGFGMIQVVNPQFDPSEVFSSPSEAAEAAATARDLAASAFASFLAGVQFRVGRVSAFAQYQINTAPRAGDLLSGAGHSVLAGFRFALGGGRD